MQRNRNQQLNLHERVARGNNMAINRLQNNSFQLVRIDNISSQVFSDNFDNLENGCLIHSKDTNSFYMKSNGNLVLIGNDIVNEMIGLFSPKIYPPDGDKKKETVDASTILSGYTLFTEGQKVKYRSHPTNCVNCGAVLSGYKCEYCGTDYSYWEGVKFE